MVCVLLPAARLFALVAAHRPPARNLPSLTYTYLATPSYHATPYYLYLYHIPLSRTSAAVAAMDQIKQEEADDGLFQGPENYKPQGFEVDFATLVEVIITAYYHALG